MDHHYLFYVLEKVKAATRKFEHGSFATYSGTEEHEACQQLERDGLVRGHLMETIGWEGLDGLREHWEWKYEE